MYALLVAIWSSTWVAIKIGLEDAPALLGAGARFALAGVLLLAFAAAGRRPLRTDWVLVALLAVFPFAITYGLVYWGEQHIRCTRRFSVRCCCTTSRSGPASLRAWQSRSGGLRWPSRRASTSVPTTWPRRARWRW
jgi:hypothetical protein